MTFNCRHIAPTGTNTGKLVALRTLLYPLPSPLAACYLADAHAQRVMRALTVTLTRQLDSFYPRSNCHTLQAASAFTSKSNAH